ncbi:MAG TPA: glycosyl hydrolase family 17 protein [Alphaproteobacteria bacterium]|nr:glycosyl hydrolase family 17 protein [Alphaproteobacteria bacterium]
MSLPKNVRKLALLVAVFACGSAATFGAWWLHGRPIAVPAAPLDGLNNGRINCVSYAPYRDDQSPFTADFHVSPEQIDEDLTVLAGHTACVRTYSTGQDLTEVVPIAKRHGLKVLAGAWIGRDDEQNKREVAAVIKLANAYPDTVSAVIVGNEVLLRGDQEPKDLARYIRQVKASVKVPVTFADVWEFWIDAPELAREVDFVTVHLLPYWEGEPMAVPRALRHVAATVKKVQAKFPGKKIFVGEVGWPSLGRMREDARPSPSDQARFLRGFITVARDLGVGYNLIEAFDQKWKRRSEGTVGGHWGLYDSNRKPKVELAGPVSDDPRWPIHWWVGTALGALILATAMVGRPLPTGKARWIVTAGLLAAVSGAALEAQAIYASETVRSAVGWLPAGAAFAMAAALAVIAIQGMLARGEGGANALCGNSQHILAALMSRRIEPTGACLLEALEVVVLVFALAAALGILFDGRQRDFPTFVYLVPALSFMALWIGGSRVAGDRNPLAHGLTLVLAVTAAATVVNEHPWNTQALAWSAVAATLALPRLVEGMRFVWRLRQPRAAVKSRAAPRRAKPA